MNTKLLGVVIVGLGAGGCAPSGADAGPDAAPPGAQDLIDDLEDGDDAILEASGRLGGWYTFNDESAEGTQVPPGSGFVPSAGGAGGSAYAATTSGSGFTVWGAGMGFDLNHPAAVGGTGPRGQYDASGFRGIVFQARGNGPVRLAFETPGPTPVDRGGTCEPSEIAGDDCDDLHGSNLALTAEWKEYQVEFSQLRQRGWGRAVPFAASGVTAVLFQTEANLAFDFSVDDVRFYE